MSDSNEVRHIELDLIATPDMPIENLSGDFKAIQFQAPWVAIQFVDESILHLPVAQVRTIRITSKQENA